MLDRFDQHKFLMNQNNADPSLSNTFFPLEYFYFIENFSAVNIFCKMYLGTFFAHDPRQQQQQQQISF